MTGHSPYPREPTQIGLGILLLASLKTGAAVDQRWGCRCHPGRDRRLPIELEPPPEGVAEGMGAQAGLVTTSGLCTLFRSAPSPAPAWRPSGFPGNEVVGLSQGLTVGTGSSPENLVGPEHSLRRKSPRLFLAEAGDANIAFSPRCGTMWSASWMEERKVPRVLISSRVSYWDGKGVTIVP